MTALHLIRVPVAIDALARWAGERGWVRARGGVFAFDEGRALHHLVDEVFGPRVFRPFRLLVPPRGRSGNLYTYTETDAVALGAGESAVAVGSAACVAATGDATGGVAAVPPHATANSKIPAVRNTPLGPFILTI